MVIGLPTAIAAILFGNMVLCTKTHHRQVAERMPAIEGVPQFVAKGELMFTHQRFVRDLGLGPFADASRDAILGYPEPLLRKAFGEMMSEIHDGEVRPEIGDYLRTLELHKVIGGLYGATNAKFGIRLTADYDSARQHTALSALDSKRMSQYEPVATALQDVLALSLIHI